MCFATAFPTSYPCEISYYWPHCESKEIRSPRRKVTHPNSHCWQPEILRLGDCMVLVLLAYSRAVALNWGGLVPQGTAGNVSRHFLMS